MVVIRGYSQKYLFRKQETCRIMYERPSISNILFSILFWSQNNHVNAAKLFSKRIFICYSPPHPSPPVADGLFSLCAEIARLEAHSRYNKHTRTNIHTFTGGTSRLQISSRLARKPPKMLSATNQRLFARPRYLASRMAARIILANVHPNEVSLHIMPSSIYMYVHSHI